MAPILRFLYLSLVLPLSVRAENSTYFKQPPETTLSANTSSQIIPNISSTSVPNFPYIIPFNQTQDCNIYGPICQTGSITVGVNLTTATTTTVLPCSSYLSAQSTHLVNRDTPDEFFAWEPEYNPDLWNWILDFGQSPECRSYADAMGRGLFTFSNCGSSNTVIQTTALNLNHSLGFEPYYPVQIPPNVVEEFTIAYRGTCCGNCSLDIPRVRLYYFPEETADCHPNQTAKANSTLPARNLERRVHSLVADGSIAVFSGHTFTSPSLYLQLVGTATVSDQCRTVGPKLIDPIITLAPGKLSTWTPGTENYGDPNDFTVGAFWYLHDDDHDLGAGIAPLKIQDLACPTWGLGESTSSDGTVYETIGPPWLPLIVPPMEMFTLDPVWSALCTGILSDHYALTTFGLIDPPIALTPAALLLPTPVASSKPVPTPADPTTIPGRATLPVTAAKPASLPNDPVAPPARTGDPGKDDPTPSPVVASAGSASFPDNSAGSSNGKDDPPSDPPSDPKVPSVPAGAGDPPAESVETSSSASDPSSVDSQQSPTDPKDPIEPAPLRGDSPQAQSQGLGAIIYNAFRNSGPEFDGSSTPSKPPQSVFTVGAQSFTASPAGFKINNAVVAPGGTAHTIDGTIISLSQSGFLAIGSSTISLTNPSDPIILAVAGHTFTPNPSAFHIGGTVVSAGGPAVIVDGTFIRLDQSGALAIASTTISLTNPPPTPLAAKAFTVAGQTFTPNPSAFSIAGTTISAEGPAVTVGGTIISLGQNGALQIDSSTISLPSPSDSSPNRMYTVAGQIFTANPSVISIAGTTISAGGPAITVGGTLISLKASGTLVVGSRTIPLLTPQAVYPSNIDIDGFGFKVQSSFVIVDGVALLPGATGVTVSGKVVSVEASGATLDIGTEHFPLPTPTGSAANNSSMNVQAFTDGQGKGLRLSILLVCGVCGTHMLLI